MTSSVLEWQRQLKVGSSRLFTFSCHLFHTVVLFVILQHFKVASSWHNTQTLLVLGVLTVCCGLLLYIDHRFQTRRTHRRTWVVCACEWLFYTVCGLLNYGSTILISKFLHIDPDILMYNECRDLILLGIIFVAIAVAVRTLCVPDEDDPPFSSSVAMELAYQPLMMDTHAPATPGKGASAEHTHAKDVDGKRVAMTV